VLQLRQMLRILPCRANDQRMKLSEKDIRALNGVSYVSAGFTLMIALTMLFGLIQLKVVKPLDSPSLLQLKEQYDKNPDSRQKAEEVRAMDLMARRAYFSSRWQVETGSYLLLAGVIIFVISRRLIAGTEKPVPAFAVSKPDSSLQKKRNRKYMTLAASLITVAALVSSFILRSELPAPGENLATGSTETKPAVQTSSAAATTDLSAVNYPFFRGEGSRGIAGGNGYPTDWDGSQGKNIKWKIPVPGEGKNSPVIWGDKLFMTGVKGTNLELYCLDKKKGELLWTGSASGFPGASTAFPESDREAGMAVPTAAVNGKYVCAIFGNGNIACFDLEGKRIWAKNLGIPKNTYGFAASLLIADNTLLVMYDTDAKVSVKGFDLTNGDEKWETKRPGRPVWSSPVLATFDGKQQVIISGNPNVSAYDPSNGEELWSLPGVTGDVAPSPAFNSKMVYVVTDYSKLSAIKPGKAGSEVWSDNAYTPDVSSPVADEELLFLTTGNGDAACYNAVKGDTLWTHIFNNPYYSSPVIADKKVWMLDRTGIMHIIEESGSFKLIGESPLGEGTDSTPAFSEGMIFIRGLNNLYCISK
jgi:outer membrane protein assembly factor BamB